MPGSPGTPPTADSPVERRLALVLATTAYTGSLRALRAPARDAADLGEVLADPLIGGFEVTSIIDGTAQQMRIAVQDFLTDRHSDDLVLVYLSCHGLVDARRRLYFAATDSDKDRLAATGVESQWLLDQLEDTRARRQVLILDCCFSGAFAHRAKAGETDLGLGERFNGQGRGRVVLTASRATEYSFEGEPVPGAAMPGSVFTSGLVDGLRSGAADVDGDGLISVDDAYAYAYERVRATDAQQTPQRWLYGAEGSIVLARSTAANPSAPGRIPPNALPGKAAQVIPSAASTLRPPARTSRLRTASSGRRSAIGRATALGTGIAVAVVIATVLAVLLHAHGSPSASSGRSDGPGRSSGTTGRFIEKAPWRLQMTDNHTGSDPGCNFTVTDAATGAAVTRVTKTYAPLLSVQVRLSGAFSWQASDSDCSLAHRPGTGRVPLPFTAELVSGDTDAFAVRPGSHVSVYVIDAGVGQECLLRLWDAVTGQEQDNKRSTLGDSPVLLDVHESTLVYLHDVQCRLRVAQA